jgi:hypothetical protein
MARGHALVYFTHGDAVVATYVVVPPISFDLAKYVPPMLAGQIGGMPSPDAAGVPLPPVPEPIEGGLDALMALAEARDDDVVAAGQLLDSAIERLLMATAEAARAYTALYRQRDLRFEPGQTKPASSLNVDDVLLDLMGDQDRIAELARRLGTLRYAIAGNDSATRDETVEAMRRIGARLAAKYRVGALIDAALIPGPRGDDLARLHIDRCYRLAAEDYAAIIDIEARIRDLENGAGRGHPTPSA